ncbi:MAG TPA: FAD-dependent oxidoreductase [Candidatus Caenarcaniphilales bacterium]
MIIVGAGPTGLSAALLLGRSLKQVLVIDSGEPRNAVSHAANGFFSRDGIAPSDLLQIGREHLHKYENVKFQTGKVIYAKLLETASEKGGSFGVALRANHFQITLNSGEQLITRKLLLATGVTDKLPGFCCKNQAFW